MFKKILIFFTFSIFSFGHSHAGFRTGKVTNNFFPADATEKTDSTEKPAALLVDPKEGFKDLFVSTTRTDGVTMEQLNPLAVSFVEDYMEKFGKKMGDMKITGRSYFNLIDEVLVQHGLPKELKYLAVIESFLKTNAKSWAGAVGPWQFMPTTARNMGLKVSQRVDERRDLFKSTHAASRYLSRLFSLYGDWLLVIAAYNGGPGTVNSAIRRSGSRDFWQLQRFLPAESRNHVKKFIATHYMMEGEGGITTLTKYEAKIRGMQSIDTSQLITELPVHSKLQSISGRYNAVVIAKHLSMDIFVFHELNPGFNDMIASKGNYPMRLPDEKMELFLRKKYDILAESIQLLLNPDGISKNMKEE